MQKRARTAEGKVMIIVAYLVAFLVLLNIQDAIFIAERDLLEDAVNSYFLCEAVGHIPGKCSRESFEQYSHPLLNIFFYITNFFLPAVMLTYLINCRMLREDLEKIKVIKTLRSISGRTSANLINTTGTPSSQRV